MYSNYGLDFPVLNARSSVCLIHKRNSGYNYSDEMVMQGYVDIASLAYINFYMPRKSIMR